MNDITLNTVTLSKYAYDVSSVANDLINDPKVSREDAARALLKVVDDISQDIGGECERATG